MKNKIGWCNFTFNPVWGCKNKCPYCYARSIAKRFYDVIAEKEYRYTLDQTDEEICQDLLASRLRYFLPTFLRSQFAKEFPKKPQRIFVGSMSEIYYWKDEWLEKVLEKVKLYPQHIFQFLTRYPEMYPESDYDFPENCWLGTTVTNNKMLYSLEDTFTYQNRIKFISIEPMLDHIDIRFIEYLNINWIIVGAETGNRKGKIIPKRGWVEAIVNYCRENNIPIYLKDSLKNIYPVEIKEFPKTEL